MKKLGQQIIVTDNKIMKKCLFIGVVNPLRAQLNFETKINFYYAFGYKEGEIEGNAKISIVLNQLIVHINFYEKNDLDHHTIRNITKNIVQNELNIFGYLPGYVYDLEITRVINDDISLDWVFGIDTNNIKKRKSIEDNTKLNEEIEKLRKITISDEGLYIRRSLADLTSALKNSEDSAFYCYRAIESLKNHHVYTKNLKGNDSKKWEGFRSACGITKEKIDPITLGAKPIRHGNHNKNSSWEEREKLFSDTWDIVDLYFKYVLSDQEKYKKLA